MFGRWLGLLRRGPDLLRATSLDADPENVEPVECDTPTDQGSGLTSNAEDARLDHRELGEMTINKEWARPKRRRC